MLESCEKTSTYFHRRFPVFWIQILMQTFVGAKVYSLADISLPKCANNKSLIFSGNERFSYVFTVGFVEICPKFMSETKRLKNIFTFLKSAHEEFIFMLIVIEFLSKTSRWLHSYIREHLILFPFYLSCLSVGSLYIFMVTFSWQSGWTFMRHSLHFNPCLLWPVM